MYVRVRRYSASRLPEVRGRACAEAAGARAQALPMPATALILFSGETSEYACAVQNDL
jgi:hypothetical protein